MTLLFERLHSAGGAAIAVFIYILLFLVDASHDPNALSVGITDLLNDTVVLAVAAGGLTLVVLWGEFDLSSIGIIAIANVVVAMTSTGSLGCTGAASSSATAAWCSTRPSEP